MRIYIAKSNKANPDYLIRIRSFLSKFKTVRVFEFQGGKYNNIDLINSDILIVIPDLSERIDDRIVLGKGLYTQIDDYINHQSIDGVFIVTGLDNDGNLKFAYIKEVLDCDDEVEALYNDTFMQVLDENNYIRYGSVNISEAKYTLQRSIAELVLVDEEDSKHYSESEADSLWSEHVNPLSDEKSKYMYVLIKN